MPTTSKVRIVVAACYLAIYAGVFAVAWQGRHGVGGGMAFTAPIMLGFPWAPLMVIAATLSQKAVAWPREFAQALWFIAVFVVPPVLNALTILFAGRRSRTPPRDVRGDIAPSGRRGPDEREESVIRRLMVWSSVALIVVGGLSAITLLVALPMVRVAP